MLRRILETVRRFKTESTPDLNSLPCVRSLFRGGIRVRVFRQEYQTGCFQYWFAVEEVMGENDRTLSVMPDGRLQTIIDLLQASLDSLDRGWRQLRSIKILEKSYYIDERLRQLRNVEDPDDFIDL
jgi:hypothetical protein